MSDLSPITRLTIVAFGLLQGGLLLVASFAAQRFGGSASDMILVPWYAVALGAPTALALILTDISDRRAWLIGLALSVVLALTGFCAAYNGEPSFGTQYTFAYIVTTFIGWYVLLPFVQACLKTGRLQPDYTDLFEFAWNNIITLLIAAIFTGIFWGLLALWAGLFQVIGVELFAQLFYNKVFVYVVTGTVFAFAISLGRNHVSAVVTVRRIILAVFKGLLPLLALIALLFLAALPFMGLQLLWHTGKGTALMLTLQILFLIFLNAVFQNGRGEPPYPNWLRELVQAATVALPVYTALCIYGLTLRIGQYGWNVNRFWAVLLTFVVGLHVVGYAIAALRRNTRWMAGIAQVNIAIAAVVVVLSVLVNSPALDPKRISTASQVGRLLSGKVAPADFDFNYLRFQLARPGNDALERLQALEGHPQATPIRTAAEQALKRTDRWRADARGPTMTTAQAREHFSVFPKNQRLEESFLEYATSQSWDIKECLGPNQRCAVLMIDLNRDQRHEYVVFRTARNYQMGNVMTKTDDHWVMAGLLNVETGETSLEKLEAQLAQGDYAAVDGRWQDLRIGKNSRRFREH